MLFYHALCELLFITSVGSWYTLFVARRIPQEKIKRIQMLREGGASVPEIAHELKVAKGTALKYVEGVEIDKTRAVFWRGKRGGSQRRMEERIELARTEARKTVADMTSKEKLLCLVSLYWAEGSKSDLSVMNSDPDMIRLIVNTIRNLELADELNIVPSVRIYEGMNEVVEKDFWSNLLGISIDRFGRTEVVDGSKYGKLQHGMCRIRVRKGGSLLKYMKALRERMVSLMGPYSSTDRARVS